VTEGKIMSGNLLSKTIVFGFAILTASCTNQVDLLDQATAKGDAFTTGLVNEYRKIARFESLEMVDWKDAEHFAAKGLAAASGVHVKPEDPDKWQTPREALGVLKEGRRRLVAILETGIRSGDPETSARAQAHFDCWVEQQEENWQQDHIAACRSGFKNALSKLEASPEVQAARFTMILFPFDSARIVPDEMQTMAELIQIAGNFGFSAIEVEGHTDRQGTTRYNKGLSRSRADAVRLALAMQGIPPALVKVSAHGESRPRVTTADGVPEPLNRRVEIWVRKPLEHVMTKTNGQYDTARAE
jgi:OOP family OmpA-OmpF porin